jgi:hypothetical protein
MSSAVLGYAPKKGNRATGLITIASRIINALRMMSAHLSKACREKIPLFGFSLSTSAPYEITETPSPVVVKVDLGGSQ